MTAASAMPDFVAFADEVYARPGVAEVALALQDEAGRDVNILLCCLYAGLVLGLELDERDIARLEQSVQSLNELAIRPLRAIRQKLKPLAAEADIAVLRKTVAAIEIDAERAAQRRMAGALPASRGKQGAFLLARVNLRRYAGDAAETLLAILEQGHSGV